MVKTNYLWDEVSDNVIAEYEGGAATAVYTQEPGLYGNPISQRRSGVSHFYHFDARGDTRNLTDASENVTDSKTYDAWGNSVLSSGSTVTPYRFIGRQGYQTDGDTGIAYVRARIYQPTIARWISADPVELTQCYRYVRSSPIDLVDASGLRCDVDFTCTKVIFQTEDLCQYECKADDFKIPGPNPKWRDRPGAGLDCDALWRWLKRKGRVPFVQYQLKAKTKVPGTGVGGFFCDYECPDSWETTLGYASLEVDDHTDPLWRCSQQDCVAACEGLEDFGEFCEVLARGQEDLCTAIMRIGGKTCIGWCETVCDPSKK